MKYIVKKDTPLFIELMALKREMNKVNEAAIKVVERLGTTEYMPKFEALAGGIDGFFFKDGNPDSKIFKKFNCGEFNMFAPKIKSELFKEVAALPIIENKRLHDIINLKYRYMYRPAMYFKENYILIAIKEEIVYTPAEHMEEIATSEFQKLIENE